MKEGVIFINVVCGICVVIEDLVDVLKLGYVVGVVVDVFLKELKVNGEEFIFLLCNILNVILILYVGGLIMEV